MCDLYHGPTDLHGFGDPSLGNADFLQANPGSAYALGMAWSGVRLIVSSLLAAIVVAGAPAGGTASYSGPLDAFAVRQKIQKDLPKINRCYESALRYEPELSGKVSVRFAVIRNGNVKGVQVLENTTGNDKVERCVARVVSALRFPSRRTGKSLRFTFPFVFAPQDLR
jgi:TonB family protein